jgi:UPF0288 family protein (methanogenesis marker protein 3)
VLGFLITIGGLLGGQTLTNKFKVEEPLHRDLHRMKEISSFRVKQEKDGITINLKLQKVENLQRVLDYVQQKVVLYYNQPIKTIKIADQRNRYLEGLSYQLSFNLEEAAVSGHYIQLKTALESYPGVKAKVYFSQNDMYLQLEKGKNYLYEVLPIATQSMAVHNPSGGDST